MGPGIKISLKRYWNSIYSSFFFCGYGDKTVTIGSENYIK